MTNNDIVINKLTQILSYLRHSKRDLKRQKKKGIGIFSNLEQEMNIKPSYESMSTVTNKQKILSPTMISVIIFLIQNDVQHLQMNRKRKFIFKIQENRIQMIAIRMILERVQKL